MIRRRVGIPICTYWFACCEYRPITGFPCIRVNRKVICAHGEGCPGTLQDIVRSSVYWTDWSVIPRYVVRLMCVYVANCSTLHVNVVAIVYYVNLIKQVKLTALQLFVLLHFENPRKAKEREGNTFSQTLYYQKDTEHEWWTSTVDFKHQRRNNAIVWRTHNT